MANLYRSLGRTAAFLSVVLTLGTGCYRPTEHTLNAPNPPAFEMIRPNKAEALPPLLPPPPPVAIKPATPREAPTINAPLPKGARAWKWIVVHHSATPNGGAAAFDKVHRDKGWDELGYHFVIGNGSETSDGLLEVGPRWKKQKWGAHAKTPDNRYNDYGIGICLVGNFDVSNPTPAQSKALSELIARLMVTYNIPPQNVIGHQDTGRVTDCPGTNMAMSTVRRNAVSRIQAMGQTVPGTAVYARTGD